MKTEIIQSLIECELSGHPVADHFVDVNKTISMPKGAEKEVPDLMLTRYACATETTIFNARPHQTGMEAAIKNFAALDS